MTRPVGLVLGREGGQLRVRTGGRDVRAVLRGKAKRGLDRAVAGDQVDLDPPDARGLWAVHAIHPRRNALARSTPDRRGRRAIASNLDHLYVLTATVNPAPVPQLIDRLLVLAEADEIPASVIVNKIDLDPGQQLRERIRQAGYQTHAVSCKSGEGLEALFAQLHDGVSVVAGPSGAGKSTLLNALQPGLGLSTATTSTRVERGRNTTVAAVMVPLAEGGYLVDTPGVSEIGLWGLDIDGLIECFPDLAPFRAECRFTNCRHLAEPGCAVRAQAERTPSGVSRYQSYVTFAEELRALPEEWE